ncbi:phage terminase small subunit P27 family [Lacticaseibacillus paracasei]|uniref:phage terminase small subunit P27 family n=1 Tax=Lacticaseibacillus paracasei TaxID=1597 RepID=UPI0021C3ADFD|nr:phage terminase small subunit P27 family [Lacticaseibacillus paracasei]MCP9311445.1 phage terminase small subunit P27 family [Lacticaseibacillus paracasei]MCP9348149.1 phage terminase small subunit P27 family [Lacticaseibacillus paracasei]MCP9367745.1 phage terminase small subunit P27 family [Lacticaseibacillus paracasei]MCP9379769.1 phage terminase small subunit P27 family [Lacticaseibacillus paracasei]WCZ18537.1 phage terminase small subunit P27 family [Lacticaseibacillus paracasei]
MGAPLKSITQMRGVMSKKKLADRREMEETLFTYQELVDQPPAWLDDYAVTEWQRIVPLLKKDIPVSELDAALIASHCQAYSDIQKAAELIQEQGMMVDTADSVKANPAVKMKLDATNQMIRIDDLLGLSVYSRAKLAVKNETKKKPDDPFADLMSS